MCFLRFIVVKENWVPRDGPSGITCLYAPTDGAKRSFFFLSLAAFILEWSCQDFVLIRILMLFRGGGKMGL